MLKASQRELLKEVLKRSRLPYLRYRPALTQEAFMKSRALFKALHGPNRGGKTFHIDMEMAMLMEDRHPYIKNSRNRQFLMVVPGRQTAQTVHKEYFLIRSRLKGPCFQVPMLNPDETKVDYDLTKKP